MMHRFTSWFPVVLLAAVAAMTVWLDQQVQPPERSRDGKSRHDPDYIVEKLAATRFGSDGLPRYSLSARRMMHYPDDDTTHLEAPKLVNFSRSSATVTATSKTAMISSNGENAYLTDDVRLVRSAYADKSEMTMQTSYLHLIPDADIAKTDKPVRVSDARILITAVGLEFNNQTRILKLLSNVRGRYEKPKPKR
ncbi:MAG: LPS export ABC transporter periplasmic protein LptC [Betaproteobacteria bacterium]|nr:LPS export ABC transporter periplasmic protein LptC [Betaproteobacteria bacterium]